MAHPDAKWGKNQDEEKDDRARTLSYKPLFAVGRDDEGRRLVEVMMMSQKNRLRSRGAEGKQPI